MRSMCGMGREAWLLISGQVNTMAVVTHRSHGCSLYNAGRIFLGSMLAVARIERNYQARIERMKLPMSNLYYDQDAWNISISIEIRLNEYLKNIFLSGFE